MEVYLVGGAVRDKLLNIPVTERDYVVVGSTPKAMIELGYRQVGRDFPVFLHPETDAEYALARTERKVAPGHTGFIVHAGPEVTLEDDLVRRDLTINAIAESAGGDLVDPVGGQDDLAARCLRHVSAAFSEDPLRVFRVARFAARFAPQGFSVAPETTKLMRAMCSAGALEELAAERVFGELDKALVTDTPGRFFEVLDEVGGLGFWFQELQGDGLTDWLDLLRRVAGPLSDPAERYATIGWVVEKFGERLAVPNEYQRLLDAVTYPGRQLPGWRGAAPDEVLSWIKRLDGLRQPARLARLLNVVECCAGVDLEEFANAIDGLNSIDVQALRRQGLEGRALGTALDEARARHLALSQRSA